MALTKAPLASNWRIRQTTVTEMGSGPTVPLAITPRRLALMIISFAARGLPDRRRPQLLATFFAEPRPRV
jgi:hypothetical protein